MESSCECLTCVNICSLHVPIARHYVVIREPHQTMGKAMYTVADCSADSSLFEFVLRRLCPTSSFPTVNVSHLPTHERQSLHPLKTGYLSVVFVGNSRVWLKEFGLGLRVVRWRLSTRRFFLHRAAFVLCSLPLSLLSSISTSFAAEPQDRPSRFPRLFWATPAAKGTKEQRRVVLGLCCERRWCGA